MADTTAAALSLKNKGNAFFSKRKFRQAAASYSEGICGLVLQKNKRDEDATILAAVLLSNRSSCRYEIGEYGKNKPFVTY